MKTVRSSFWKMTGQFNIILVLIFFSGLFSCEMQDEFAPAIPDNGIAMKNGFVLPEPLDWVDGIGYWDFKLPIPKEAWNLLPEKYLIVFTHGMVFPEPWEEVLLPNDEIGGKPVEQIVLDMGFAYATTSYENNGLVAEEAVENVKNLVGLVKDYMVQNEMVLPDYWVIAGPSEGGLVAVLTLEKYPELFDGGLSVCGPIGSMYYQMQTHGHFHVLFNYFFGDFFGAYPKIPFPGIGSPLGVTPETMDSWYEKLPFPQLKSAVLGVMATNPGLTQQFIRCSKATIPIGEISEEEVGAALIHLLGYNVMLTNNVYELLDGCIFNNKYHWYSGSDNDFKLNKEIQRIMTADYFKARRNLQPLETTGNIKVPLVTMHTTKDYLVPFWHQPLYRMKILRKGKIQLYTGIPVEAYGHCTITQEDLLNAINILFEKMKYMAKVHPG